MAAAAIEIETSFVLPGPSGTSVIGRSSPVHEGKRPQAWQSRLEAETAKLVCPMVRTENIQRSEVKS